MAEPTLSREGNLRFASLPCRGYPADPWAMVAEVKRLLAGQDIEIYGAVSIFFSLPVDDLTSCECQVGSAISGLGRPLGTMMIEDYRQLTALSLPHAGPVRELATTYQRLEAHARAQNRGVRPYWRLALRNQRMADGNVLPAAEASLFLDR